MACKWRIRHKMVLGMALVVAIMAVLLMGAVKGLQGFRFAMRAVESKLAELEKAVALKDAAGRLLTHRDLPLQAARIKSAVDDEVRPKFDAYREALNATVEKRRAVDQGFHDLHQADAIAELLQGFDLALARDLAPTAGAASPDLLSEGKEVRRFVDRLRTLADDVIAGLNRELLARTNEARTEQRTSLVILVSSSVAAVLAMIGMLRFFYRWVVKPIRTLEEGVSRVGRGDFTRRIDIRSGDEIESFANAYNTMAGELDRMYRDLERQVNERSRQLVRSERLAGVGFLAAGVAHEINNPLASIAFCSEALESRMGDLCDPRTAGRATPQDREIVAKYLKMIQEEAFRCKEITQKLLAFSRGGDRKRERTDLAEIIQGVIDMVQHVPNSKGKTILFPHREPIEAWVNAQEVKQVFLNLVVNALDSMDEGGTLTIDARTTAGQAVLAFRDTGCGMTDEVLENIFEPFFTRSRTGKGTGLGLSISHRIVGQHGGEIEATSAGPDQGSTFVVRLPTDPPAQGDGDDADATDPETIFSRGRAGRRAA